jgi:hypothetical protein
MIFMVLSCVLCMTLIVFIYVYYGLFICTNLVDVISLFFTGFSFHLPNLGKNWPVSDKNRPKLTRRFSKKPADLSVKPAAFRCFWFSLFLHRLRCVSTEFFQLSPILLNFLKTDMTDPIFFVPPNFQTLKEGRNAQLAAICQPIQPYFSRRLTYIIAKTLPLPPHLKPLAQRRQWQASMAVGKNKRISKGKKGGKKKT